MQPVSSSQLLAALDSIQAGLGRQRPLVRVRQQLLGDLAALLTGLRCVLMLDYAPGTTPQQLAQALAPLQHTLPLWKGCTLELDGCCYLANSAMLLQQLSQLVADQSCWPFTVSFAGPKPQQLQEGCDQLQQQIHQLHAAVAAVLGPAGQQYACSTSAPSQQQQQLGSSCPDSVSEDDPPGSCAATAAGRMQQQSQQQQTWLPHIKLDSCPGLPAMPTLNGLLLGYPVLYYVRDHQEAAVASRMLSASQLKLCRVVATCAPQLSAMLTAAVGQVSSKMLMPQSTDSTVLMSFTVPATLSGADDKVQQAVRRLQGKQGCVCDVWTSVDLNISIVGPQAVSL